MDLYIIGALWILAVLGALGYVIWRHLRKSRKTEDIASTICFPRPPGPSHHYDPIRSRPSYAYAYMPPGAAMVETNSGFSEGLVIGSMMAAGEPAPVIVSEPDTSQSSNDSASFSGFSGGDSGGGGASSSWDSGSSDSSCSSSDSGSSCDSGSSGGDF